MQDLTPELAENYGLEDTGGIIITEVVEDSPAAKAGLEFEDIIVEFEGVKVNNRRDLMNRVAQLPPDTKVEMVVIRDGKRKEINAALGERPSEIAAKQQDEVPANVSDLGLEVQNLTEEMADKLGYSGTKGVVVTNVDRGSEASRQGIEPGMMILQVNRGKIENTDDFYREIGKVQKGQSVIFLVSNGRNKMFVTLKVPKD